MISYFSDLRYKEVVDVRTGTRMGYVCDAEFDENGTYSTRLTDELARNLLSLVAQQHTPEMTSMTQYSVIYNQSALTADVWLSRDYSKKYTFKVR